METQLQLYKDVNDKAIVVANKYKIKAPIKSPDKLISTLGGIIIEEPIEKDGRGFVKKESFDSEYKFSIHISSDTDEKVRTFNIMTNLGYLFLSLGYDDEAKWKNSDMFDIEHNYNAFLTHMAEEFALALLIPEQKLDKYKESCSFMGIVNNKKLAEKFGVTVDMIIKRRTALLCINGCKD